MKSSVFAEGLIAFSKAVDALSVTKCSDTLRDLASVFAAAGEKTVAQAIKVDIKNESAVEETHADVVNLSHILEECGEFAKIAGAAGFSRDAMLVRDFLRKCKGVDLGNLIKVWLSAFTNEVVTVASDLDTQVIQRIIERIEKSYRDPVSFEALANEIKRPKNRGGLSEASMRAVASHFWSSVGRSTKRAEAFRLIMKLHSDYVIGQKKDVAVSIRSAA